MYDELWRLAADMLGRQNPGHSLQSTALVHEGYLRLVGGDQGREWDGSSHFFAAAAEAMRRILVDDARHKKSQKSGGGRPQAESREDAVAAPDQSDELLAVDEALEGLAAAEPQSAELVKLRYCLSINETAQVLNISPWSANRLYAYTRAWLQWAVGTA